MSRSKNIITRFVEPGATVRLLHQIGRAAVAWVYPVDKPPYLAIRFRAHYATANALHDLPIAFDEVRGKEGQNKERENEQLNQMEALAHHFIRPACLDDFCAKHQLDPAQSYARADIRRAILAKKLPDHKRYLSLLNQLEALG